MALESMKRNMIKVMDRLDIDEGIRPLIEKLWRHCYRTLESCEGEKGRAYVLFDGGDGWFEGSSEEFGFFRAAGGECCDRGIEKVRREIIKYGMNSDNFVDKGKSCNSCGAGINGYVVYEKR